jgi:hypothetical protein
MKKQMQLSQVSWVDSHQNWKNIKKHVPIAPWMSTEGHWSAMLVHLKTKAYPNWLENNGSWRDHLEPSLSMIQAPVEPEAIKPEATISELVHPMIDELVIPPPKAQVDELTIEQLEAHQPQVIDDEGLAVIKREELFLKQALSIASTFLPSPLQYAVFVPPPILSQNSQVIRQLQGSYLFAIHPEYLILATIDRKNKWAFDASQISMLFFNQGYFNIRLNDGKELSIDLSKFDDHLQKRLESEIQNWSKVIDKNTKNR